MAKEEEDKEVNMHAGGFLMYHPVFSPRALISLPVYYLPFQGDLFFEYHIQKIFFLSIFLHLGDGMATIICNQSWINHIKILIIASGSLLFHDFSLADVLGINKLIMAVELVKKSDPSGSRIKESN